MADTICVKCKHYKAAPGNSSKAALKALCLAEGAKVGTGRAAQAYWVLGTAMDVRCVSVNTEGKCSHYEEKTP